MCFGITKHDAETFNFHSLIFSWQYSEKKPHIGKHGLTRLHGMSSHSGLMRLYFYYFFQFTTNLPIASVSYSSLFLTIDSLNEFMLYPRCFQPSLNLPFPSVLHHRCLYHTSVRPRIILSLFLILSLPFASVLYPRCSITLNLPLASVLYSSCLYQFSVCLRVLSSLLLTPSLPMASVLYSRCFYLQFAVIHTTMRVRVVFHLSGFVVKV